MNLKRNQNEGEEQFKSFAEQNFFHNLDWLRGLSILLVILHHVPSITDGPFRILQANGRFGVSLFFVISGFLICTLLLREQRHNGRISLRDFYIRRGLRLFPLYYSVLGIYCIAILGLGLFSPENRELFVEKLPSYLLYYSNLTERPTDGPFFFSWSLAVEEQFYLCFSILAYAFGARTLVGIITACYFLKIAALGLGADTANVFWRILLSYQESVLAGVGLALALHFRRIFQIIAPILAHRLVLSLNAMGLVFILVTVQIHDKHGALAQLVYVLMTALVGGACLRDNIPFIGNKLSIHVGKISYGIYLLHMIAIIISKKVFGESTWPVFATSTVGVVIGASLVYRYFEAPIIQLKTRFSPPR